MLFGGDWTPQSSAENMTGCLGTVSLLFLVCVFNTHGLSEGAPLFPQKNLGHLTLLFQAIESVFFVFGTTQDTLRYFGSLFESWPKKQTGRLDVFFSDEAFNNLVGEWVPKSPGPK